MVNDFKTELFCVEYNNSQLLPGGGKNQKICDYDKPPKPGNVCAVDINSAEWGPCVYKNNYSYPTANPCVFLKLNRVSRKFEVFDYIFLFFYIAKHLKYHSQTIS